MVANHPEELTDWLQQAERLHCAGALTEAAHHYRRILAGHPGLPLTSYNLGIILNELGDYGGAEQAFRQALAHQPEFPEAWLNLGFALQEQGQIHQAMEYFRRLSHLPHQASTTARFNLACLQLLCGNLRQGWPDYELRFQTLQPVLHRHGELQEWDGTIRPGIRLLVHTEQGYGDAIQMARYLPLLAAEGVEVHLETTAPLASLLATLPGLKSCTVRGDSLPQVDFQVPIMSLPGLLGTTLETLPAPLSYLTPAPQRRRFWKALLPAGQHLRVGLAWAGRLDLPVNRKRSLPPQFLAPLLSLPDTLFVSLQPDLPEGFDTHDPRIHSWPEHLHDFHDTAALIANLDLVITIDTAVAHLAGALGVPTWLLLPHVPDWRWLLERHDCPWYPSMRLFRQPATGLWEPLIGEVCQELQRHLQPRLFLYQPGRDFQLVEHLGSRPVPLVGGEGKTLAPGVGGRLVDDPAQADLFLFPHYLEHLTEHSSIAGMRSFITGLPHFRTAEARHIFFSDHDSWARYHTGSWWGRASLAADQHDQQAFAIPYPTEDLGDYLHFDPQTVKYHTSFVGYIGTRRERARLLNGVISEKGLVHFFDTVDSFHGHQPLETRQARRRHYLEVMASSLTVLCPEGAGLNSIRFFETLSMGRIPVLVSRTLLPFAERIDYDRFTVRIPFEQQDQAGAILLEWLRFRSTEELLECCRQARRTWEEWFAPTAMGGRIFGQLVRLRLAREHHPYRGAEVQAAAQAISAADPLPALLACLEQNDLASAADHLQVALQSSPCNPLLHNLRGLLALRGYDPAGAEQAFLETIQYDHRYYEAYLELGALYYSKGRLEQAAERYFEATLIRPNDPHPYQAAIAPLAKLGRYQEALHCCRKALSLGAKDPELLSLEQRLLALSASPDEPHV